jgi:hypothetical protein
MEGNDQLTYSKLACAENRSRSVLVIAGAGVNIWHYLPFLSNFSVQALNEFKAIYAASGGAGAFWAHCLLSENQFRTEDIGKYDGLVRSVLNRLPLYRRLGRMLLGKYAYDAADLLTVMSNLITPNAKSITFSQSAVSSFHVIGHRLDNQSALAIGADNFPNLEILRAIANCALPERIGRRLFGKRLGLDGFPVSDFEFAPQEIRRAFRRELVARYPDDTIYWVNIRRSGIRGSIEYVKVSADKFPTLMQAYDFALAFFGIPNERFRKVSCIPFPIASTCHGIASSSKA